MHCEELVGWLLEAKQWHLQVIGAPGQIICLISGSEATLLETGFHPLHLGMRCAWNAISDSYMCNHSGWVANMKGNLMLSFLEH